MSEALRIQGHVLPGGEERELFVVEDKMFFDAGGDVRTLVEGGWILPGLVDCHAHLGMAAPGGTTPAERVRASARAHLDAGVLAVREPGGPDDSSAELGPWEGLPTVFSAGRFLAAPGGYIPGLAREVEPGGLAAAAGETAASGRPWVKIVADWYGPSGIAQTFGEQELIAAVAAAHEHGARVAVHATLDATVLTCVNAEVDTIEHGTFVSAETVDVMLGTAWVPTLLANDAMPAIVSQRGAPPAILDSVAAGIAKMPAMLRRARDAGVRILAGTDAGLGPHGMAAEEIWRLRFAGLEPEEALAAGSWDAREYLGLRGIEDGAPADLVVYAEDPRDDLGRLRRPQVIVLAGQVASGG